MFEYLSICKRVVEMAIPMEWLELLDRHIELAILVVGLLVESWANRTGE